MPTWLVEECLDVLISPKIVNISLSLGVFPKSRKVAIVKTLIKKNPA